MKWYKYAVNASQKEIGLNINPLDIEEVWKWIRRWLKHKPTGCEEVCKWIRKNSTINFYHCWFNLEIRFIKTSKLPLVDKNASITWAFSFFLQIQRIENQDHSSPLLLFYIWYTDIERYSFIIFFFSYYDLILFS